MKGKVENCMNMNMNMNCLIPNFKISGSDCLPSELFYLREKIHMATDDKNIETFNDLYKMTADEKLTYFKAYYKESEISKDVITVTKQNGGKLVGFNHRLKSIPSAYQKTHCRTEERTFESLHDIVRYTQVYDADRLADSILNSLSQLIQKGYVVEKLKNSWLQPSSPYKGIHAQLVSPNGQKFEIQYHTQESFDLTRDSHDIYDRYRELLNKNSPESKKLYDMRLKLANSLHIPPQVNKVSLENLLQISSLELPRDSEFNPSFRQTYDQTKNLVLELPPYQRQSLWEKVTNDFSHPNLKDFFQSSVECFEGVFKFLVPKYVGQGKDVRKALQLSIVKHHFGES